MLTQLDGHYLEMSPQKLAGFGLVWHPAEGISGSLAWDHVGSRFLNKRNTVKAPAYNTIDASLGTRIEHWKFTTSSGKT